MEWWNWGTLGLGVLGAALGIRSELWRHSERKRERNNSYAYAIVQLKPILASVENLPIRTPDDLSAEKVSQLLVQLEAVEKALKEVTPSVISSVPHMFESVDEMTESLSQIRFARASGTREQQVVLTGAFANLYNGARSLTLFEKYKAPMLGTDEKSSFQESLQSKDFQERSRSFRHERMRLDYEQDA